MSTDQIDAMMYALAGIGARRGGKSTLYAAFMRAKLERMAIEARRTRRTRERARRLRRHRFAHKTRSRT